MGWLKKDVVDAATRAAARMRAAPFEVMFDRVASFDGRRDKLPFVLRSMAATQPCVPFVPTSAHGFVEEAIRLLEATGFEPHVTLAYDARKVAIGPVAPVVWRVEEFVLIHSLLGQTRRLRLGRWGAEFPGCPDVHSRYPHRSV
ncbi:hypothetical protein [Rhodanobacter lindaniclasticus]